MARPEDDDDRTLPVLDAVEGGVATVLGDRYELIEPIGAGASGTVWRGRDGATGLPVAVKLVPIRTTSEAVRARREAAALRLAQLEGVARLVDDGIEHGQHVLVMSFVEGRPFPGKVPPAWPTLAPLAIRLLEAVGRLHGVNLIHRDLKPPNVLVDDAGKLTLVDLGIARGPSIGPTVTAEGGVVGTPRYLAPEQARGERVDHRADLYAVGVMLYEALAGAPPFHEERGIHHLIAAKFKTDPVPLARAAPGVPLAVAAVIDRLLARVPDERPRTAQDVIAALSGTAVPDTLPWIGTRTPIDVLVLHGAAGTPASVSGPPGSGRSRVLDEAARALRELGRDVRRLVPALRPLESLHPVLGAPTVDSGAIASAETTLRALLARGTVLVVDDPERLDRWSRALVGRVRDGGAVLTAEATGGTVVLASFTVEDLASLFHGPDIVLHLRTDAAALLHDRTAGVAARVEREVEAWVSRGVARWREGRIAIDRVGIQRVAAGLVPAPSFTRTAELVPPLDDLLGWIALAGQVPSKEVLRRATGLPTWEIDAEVEELTAQGAVRSLPGGAIQAAAAPSSLRRWTEEDITRAHGALASALPPGAPGRILHLIAADRTEELAAEALLAGRRLLDTGAAMRAVVVLGLGLGRLGAGARPDLARDLAEELARAALTDDSAPVIASAAADLSRRPEPGAAGFGKLLSAWAALRAGDAEMALARVDGLAPFDDLELEAFRQLVAVRVALARDPEEAARLVQGTRAGDDAFLLRRRREWLGQIRLLQGRTVEAAEIHLGLAADEPVPRRRTRALVNAGLALLHVDLDRAEPCLLAALEQAERARLPEFEAFTRVGLRQVAYRREQALDDDGELRAAVHDLDIPRLEAELVLLDAALAWRRGDLPAAATLASAAEALWRAGSYERGVVLARALGYACGARTADPAAVVEAARSLGFPELLLQVAGLVAAGGGWTPAPEMRVELMREAEDSPSRRRAVLAPAEALLYLRAAGGL